MRKYLFVLSLIASLATRAQPFNNEWINYSQPYYKFKIGTNGLFRIKQPVLASLGLASTGAEQFQLWRNGKEIPLYITIASGPLGSSDYIEFWGEANDGLPDKSLYRQPDFQLSDRYSLLTDTASFFLTVTSGGGHLRYSNTPNNLPSALPAEPYFMYKTGAYFREKINRGFADVNSGTYLYSSSYDIAEGWSSNDFDSSYSKQMVLSGLQAYTGGGAPNALLSLTLAGTSANNHTYEVKLNGTTIHTQSFSGFNSDRSDINLTPAQLNTSTLTTDIINTSNSTSNRLIVAKAELSYARQFNFGGTDKFRFTLAANAAGNYLEIAGFNYGSVSPVLYDLTNNKRYTCDISAAPLVRVLLQGSATARELLLVSQAPAVPADITNLELRNFINYNLAANRGDYLIISNPHLTTGPGGSNPLENYRAYRSSPAGGNYSAKIYMVDELTDQFAFGIKQHPHAVRNFIRWAKANYPVTPKFVLLAGKGVNYIQYQSAAAAAMPDLDKLAQVPTFGEPASDNLLSADDLLTPLPSTPIGRISVISGDELSIYLDKLKQYELQQATLSPVIADKAWTKTAVHVIGASEGILADFLTQSMQDFKTILADTLYGANVQLFSKASSAPVEQSSGEALAGLFQSGIGIMTYFGHSSASALEFNLDNPENYNNTGKYPINIVLGCNAGNLYNANPIRLTLKETISEKFVLANQRGSIAFIASSHFGVPNNLYVLNHFLYKEAGINNYGRPVGEMLRNSLSQSLATTFPGDYYMRIHCEQQTLHGDPALRAQVEKPKPDYAIEAQYLKITPAFISVAENSFTVKAKMFNLAKAVDKNIVVELRRTFPDLHTEVIRRDTIPGIRYMDSLSYTIPIVATRDKGLNKISICIDADNVVDELFETNNCTTQDVFIFEDEARPVFPYNFSIVNRSDIKLVASTANPFSSLKQYTMEMDTTALFNSPLKITRSISSTGGVLEFTPGIPYTDSTVYYWRVAPVPTSGSPVWNMSSFIYIPPAGSNRPEGFNQSHHYQHTASTLQRMTYNTAARKWEYNSIPQEIYIQMGTWITSGCTDYTCISVSLNGVPNIRLVCWFSTLVFNVIDPVSFRPWQNHEIAPAGPGLPIGQGLYGSGTNNCPGETRFFNFEYRYTDTASRRNIMNFMRDTIPDGHFVIVRNATLINAFGLPQAWANDWRQDEAYFGTGQTIYHYLRNAGFAGIDSFYKCRPWALVYKKNDPSFTPVWYVGIDSIDNPTLTVNVRTSDTTANMLSPLFGPAKAWKQMIWRGTADAAGDTAVVDIIGVDNNGIEQTLFTGITTAQPTVDITSINAVQYPFLKLKLRTSDKEKFTPYQLRYWRLLYDPAPEGAIAANIFLQVKDTVDAGEPLDFKVAFKNVSQVPFDSLKLKMQVTDRNNLQHIIPLPKKRPLLTAANAPADTVQIGGLINTTTLPGINTVFLEANPDNDQPEQYHFNNFAYRTIYVRPDSLHPLLDVTFDGAHILNRDIVSAKPDILIRLKDESRWMSLDDTALLNVQVRYPDGSLRRFYFSNRDTMQFIPAGSAPVGDNTAAVNLRPWFTQDGEYELLVTGRDRSNNSAGAISYKVVFEVITKAMISNMLNYPNPFTTSTAFVFTLTGSEVPQQLKIEIMTVTGKIVREITQAELGPIRIGRNITEFKWDGTDQYGGKLANGIYLYRVVTNLNGKSLEKYSNSNNNTDRYFNSGYGKMYLMR